MELIILITFAVLMAALFVAHRASKWLRRIVTQGRAAWFAADLARWFASLATLTVPTRTVMLAVVVLASAGIVTAFVAPVAPDTLDELAIPALAAFHLIFTFARISKHQVATSSTCQFCGYDLSQTPDKPCPECGAPFIEATTVNGHALTLSPAGTRTAKGWALGALAIMLCAPVGHAAAVTRHMVHGINWSNALQLVQQYEGQASASILSAKPLAIAAATIVLTSPFLEVRRLWLLIPLGIAASFALRLFI